MAGEAAATGEDRLLHQTTSLCRRCKDAVPARVVESGGAVWMRKLCPTHGADSVRLSTDPGWYERTRAIAPAPNPPRHRPKEIHEGCPFDCGACAQHEQRVRLPVVTITSACNLDCPICYVHNKNEQAFHMELGEYARILDRLREEGGGEIDLVNFTGGEPTVHPRFLDFLELSAREGVHRVSICTNGIRLATDEALVERLAAIGARVALSFDTFEHDADVLLQGAELVALKQRCLALLEKHGVDTTLIPVMTKGVNDHEVGRIIALALSLANVRHVEVHTITYTGQGGATFQAGAREGRISMVEVLERIEETTGGMLRVADFVPSPCAHPLCYQIAYLLLDPDGGAPIPFTRFLPRDVFYRCLGEHLYMEPSRTLESALLEAIDRLWLEDDAESQRTLGILKRLLGEMFPRDRSITREEALRVSERASKAVYVHAHMDEDTFDVERVAQCCDSNCYADGTTIPVCSYNVIYRETEEHFMLKPVARVAKRGGARSLPVVR